jgi:hypothetical protein
MATDNFREEIPWQLRKFMERRTGRRPAVLWVNDQDARNWIYRESFAGDPSAFVGQKIEPFVKSLRYDAKTLSECAVELLDVEDSGTTRFE